MTDQEQWQVGATSARFESATGDPGAVSTGRGDHGGASYGTYQLATGPGTLQKYLRQSRFGEHFNDLTPGTPAFNDKWREVAAEHPGFGADQHDFIKRTHVDPAIARLAARGIDVEGRGSALQDLVWSTAVQYPSAPGIVIRGLEESFGKDFDAQSLTDREIVDAVQDSKLRHIATDFRSSDARNRAGVETRIASEKAALGILDETGRAATNAEFARLWNEASPIKAGAPSSRVTDLQEKLASLEILNERGQRIQADGDFGPSTRQAVLAYQRSVGLPESGEVGPLMMSMLDQQVKVRRQDVHANEASQIVVCRLDDRKHADFALYEKVRERIVALDHSLGRTPDQYTDNIASALTVQARSDGLQRVDQVALSPDGTKLWGVQIPPGRRDHLFDLQTCVQTSEANTPMEQSAERWPEAMQQFQQHEFSREASQQRAQDRIQAEAQQAEMTGPTLTR